MRPSNHTARILLLIATAALTPVHSAQAGFSITYSDNAYQRPHYPRAYPYRPGYRPGPRFYQDRYGKRYRRNPPFYQNRFGRRFRHHYRHGRRFRGCDVVIVRPRHGRPYVLERYCPYRPVRRHRRIPGSHR